jgi:hydroxymethylglutaryl-CoA synthase
MSTSRPVGIDAIAVHVPRLYLDLCGEWAAVRAAALGETSVEALVGKLRRGVGVEQMAIPDAHEDSATLAAMAAARVIENAGIDPREIGAIAVGTETTVDQSKSIAAYVLGMLERRFGVDLREVGAPQFQFACIGATYALESVVNAFRAGEATKRYGLVIATDVSRYPLVAMLVCEDPRLLAFDARVQATITRDERDFFRPNGLSTATVDGKYSIDVYLDCIGEAARLFRGRLGDLRGVDEPLDRALNRLVFHIPFPRMAEYAALRVLGETWHPDVPPSERRTFERELAKTERFKEFFASRISSSLELSRRVGNIYSGSMYLGLVSLLENTADAACLQGERVGFFSYGSGASARVFSGVFVDPSSHVNHARKLVEGAPGARVPLSLEQYEALHRGPHDPSLPLALRQPAPSVLPPEGEFALRRVGTEVGDRRTDLGYRYYDWVA